MDPNGDQGRAKITQETCPGRGPRNGLKKNAPPRESLKPMGSKSHIFWSHVAYFGVTFSMLFQSSFFVDLLMVLGLIFDGLLDVFSMIFGPFSRTPEPLFFDNSTVC